MSRIKNFIIIVSLFAAAGLTYTIISLKNMPDIFDWTIEEEEEDEC